MIVYDYDYDYSTQHRTVRITFPFIMQTMITAHMLSTGELVIRLLLCMP